jgi:hypothetical protein
MNKGLAEASPLSCLVRPKRFELLTPWFVAKYSIQLSYGRFEGCALYAVFCINGRGKTHDLAETEGFEPSIQV